MYIKNSLILQIRYTLTRVTIILLILLGLTSCSRTELIYDYADWLIINRTNHYFDITSEQRSFLKNRLQDHLAWHRQSEMPLYAHFLLMFRTKAENGLTKEELDWAFENLDTRRQVLFERLLPDTVYFLAMLEPAQIAHFEKKVIKDGQGPKVEKSPEKIKQQLEERADETIENMEDWFGSLSKAQTYRVRALSMALPNIKEDWSNYRQMRRKELITLLRQKKSPSEIEAHLKFWLLKPKEAYPPEYKEKFERMHQETKTMILQIDQLITPKQRQKALKKLGGYIRDFQNLGRY
jgi:hypothetical protein